jgi:hypothetical protein
MPERFNWNRETLEEYKLTCKDFDYTGVECCPTCHEPDLADYELRIVRIDGVNALLCCSMTAFFYPKDPSKGLSPEEILLNAIFGEPSVHPAAEKYIDPEILKPDNEDEEFSD